MPRVARGSGREGGREAKICISLTRNRDEVQIRRRGVKLDCELTLRRYLPPFPCSAPSGIHLQRSVHKARLSAQFVSTARRARTRTRAVSRRLNHARRRAVRALRARGRALAHGASCRTLYKEEKRKGREKGGKRAMIGWPRQRRKNTRTRRARSLARPRANKNANRSSILCAAVENETLKPAGPAARPGAH